MQPFKKKIETTISAVFVTIAIVGLGIFWLRYLNQSQNFEHKVENVNLNLVSDNKCKNFMWSPVLKDPTGENQIIVPQTNCKLSVYTAWFDEIQNELASDLHKSFDANNFSVESTSTTRIDGRDFRVTYLVSLKEDKVAVVTWYELGERVFTNKLQVKAFQIWRRLNGEPFGGRLWMAAALEGDVEHLKAHITEYM